ncbi:1133_t:CDS:1, partial [Paraglomus brasilianum]
IPISSEKNVIFLLHSTGTWLMLVNKVESLEPQLEELDYYFTDKETKEAVKNTRNL